MNRIKFTKMVATGNDFIVIDNRYSYLVSRIPSSAKRLCDRRNGIGADGLLLLEKSRRADFKMRIFNPDGSEAEMCGNGLRCIAQYAAKKRIVSSNMMLIETKAGLLKADVKGDSVKINIIEPKNVRLGIDIEIDRRTYQLNYIDTGVPHAIYFTDNVASVDLLRIGRAIRIHRAFSPRGTNVDFVQLKGKNSVLMRTYERGVEAETLACGTGAVASAIISNIVKGSSSPVKVITEGGELTVYFKRKDKGFSNVYLQGNAKEVFEGILTQGGSYV